MSACNLCTYLWWFGQWAPLVSTVQYLCNISISTVQLATLLLAQNSSGCKHFRDHSFLRNVEFWADPAEFAYFRGISMFSRNFAEFSTGRWYKGQMRHISVEFRLPYCMYCIHDFTTKYTTSTRSLTGGILKILSSVYLKYCQLIW